MDNYNNSETLKEMLKTDDNSVNHFENNKEFDNDNNYISFLKESNRDDFNRFCEFIEE